MESAGQRNHDGVELDGSEHVAQAGVRSCTGRPARNCGDCGAIGIGDSNQLHVCTALQQRQMGVLDNRTTPCDADAQALTHKAPLLARRHCVHSFD
jgi:hypothetical protein